MLAAPLLPTSLPLATSGPRRTQTPASKRTRELSILDLPPEIHSEIALHLDSVSHRSLASTSRLARLLHGHASSRRLALEGVPQLLRALDLPDWGRRGWYRCPHANGHRHPFYQPDDEEEEEERGQRDSGMEADEGDLDDAFDGHGGGCHLLGRPIHASSHDVKSLTSSNGKKLALRRLRELHLQSPAQWPNRGRAENTLLLHSVAVSLGIPNLVAAMSKAAPELQSLTVDQSLIPLSKRLSLDISLQNPQLRHLSFHSRFCDASGLAHLLSSLPHLETLEVSSVGTCPCQPLAVKEGTQHLSLALSRHTGLRRLVLISSKALGVEKSLLLRRLAQASLEAPPHNDRRGEGEVESFRLELRELELRRSPVEGSALNAFLSSPASRHLRKLTLGGLRRVKSRHLLPPSRPEPSSIFVVVGAGGGQLSDFWTSKVPLELHLDGLQLSLHLLRKLRHRLHSLRLYVCSPTPSVESVLLQALKDKEEEQQQRVGIPRLTMLRVIIRSLDPSSATAGHDDEERFVQSLRERLESAAAAGRIGGATGPEVDVRCPWFAPSEGSTDGEGSSAHGEVSCDGLEAKDGSSDEE